MYFGKSEQKAGGLIKNPPAIVSCIMLNNIFVALRTNSRSSRIAVALVVFCIFDAILFAIGFILVGTLTILALSMLGYLLHSNSHNDMTGHECKIKE